MDSSSSDQALIPRYHCTICKRDFPTQEQLSLDVFLHHMAVLPQNPSPSHSHTNNNPENYQKGMSLEALSLPHPSLLLKVLSAREKINNAVGFKRPSTRLFSCGYCKQKFYYGYELVYHFIDHMDDPDAVGYVDKIIGVGNANKIPMLSLALNKPLSEQPCHDFKCHECNLDCECLQVLIYHFMAHPHPKLVRSIKARKRRSEEAARKRNHPNEPAPVPKKRRYKNTVDYEVAQAEHETIFMCKHCPKSYKDIRSFNEHKAISHTAASLEQNQGETALDKFVKERIEEVQKKFGIFD